MVKVKDNYKKSQNDLTCRWCLQHNETQKHILEECKKFKSITKQINENEIFTENTKILKTTNETLQQVYKELEKKKLW